MKCSPDAGSLDFVKQGNMPTNQVRAQAFSVQEPMCSEAHFNMDYQTSLTFSTAGTYYTDPMQATIALDPNGQGLINPACQYGGVVTASPHHEVYESLAAGPTLSSCSYTPLSTSSNRPSSRSPPCLEEITRGK